MSKIKEMFMAGFLLFAWAFYLMYLLYVASGLIPVISALVTIVGVNLIGRSIFHRSGYKFDFHRAILYTIIQFFVIFAVYIILKVIL